MASQGSVNDETVRLLGVLVIWTLSQWLTTSYRRLDKAKEMKKAAKAARAYRDHEDQKRGSDRA